MTRRQLSIVAASRLHFGMFSFGHVDERQFGGVGAMIAEPRLELSITASARFVARGLAVERVGEFAERIARRRGWAELPACQIEVRTAPPPHVGLGSGTQLGLAVAAGLSRWCDAEPPPRAALPGCGEPTAIDRALDWAALAGRGQRSSVGAYGFALGGMIVEAGKLCASDRPVAPNAGRSTDATPADDSADSSPLLAHIPLPDAWRFVLVMPRHAPGLSGDAERRAFARLPPTPRSVTADLCREALLHLVPAAHRGQFDEFSASLHRFNHLAGVCFAASQGGPFASGRLAELVATIRNLGVPGVGQSSWGPTLFALLPDAAAAEDFVSRLSTVAAEWELRCVVTPVANRGAAIDEVT